MGPENGWRSSVLTDTQPMCCEIAELATSGRRDAGVRGTGLSPLLCVEAMLGVSLGGAAPGADLGGSSKYSNEILED